MTALDSTDRHNPAQPVNLYRANAFCRFWYTEPGDVPYVEQVHVQGRDIEGAFRHVRHAVSVSLKRRGKIDAETDYEILRCDIRLYAEGEGAER